MRVQCVRDASELAPFKQRWDELAGDCVFRSSTWLTTWWKHYGEDQPNHGLFVVLVFDDEADSQFEAPSPRACGAAPSSFDHPDESRLVAILPCYIQSSLVKGRTLRLLADGEVCSDYLDLLVEEKYEQRAVEFIASFFSRTSDDWDTTFLTASESTTALRSLILSMQSRGFYAATRPGASCWSIDLPDQLDDMLAGHSKSHRKKVRRLARRAQADESVRWHLVESPADFEKAWPIFRDLHQRRRQSLGEPGCFASPRWAAFQRDVARQLLDAGQLRLSWLESSGSPIAAEYNFASGQTTFAYQSGLDPERLDEEPGRVSMIFTVEHAIAEGHSRFDLLIGDESYKSHWRAIPEATTIWQVVPPRPAARWRHRTLETMRIARTAARRLIDYLRPTAAP